MTRSKLAEEARISAGLDTRTLIREIKELSGLSAEKLSDALSSSHGLVISGGLLRQYMTGNKPASPSRKRALAEAATRLGWAGKTCEEVLFWTDPLLRTALRARQSDDDIDRRTERCVRKLDGGLNGLFELGFDIEDIEYLVGTRIRALAKARSR
jgi:hypothetical protein